MPFAAVNFNKVEAVKLVIDAMKTTTPSISIKTPEELAEEITKAADKLLAYIKE